LKRVNSLLGNSLNGWNEDLVNSTFFPHDAAEILKIRVPTNSNDDTIAWHYENTRIFSVKSTYKLAYSIKTQAPNASSGNPDGNRMMWEKIWKADVPQ
jgi:hypothetical protein